MLRDELGDGVGVGHVERQVGAGDVHPGRLERVGGCAADAARRRR